MQIRPPQSFQPSEYSDLGGRKEATKGVVSAISAGATGVKIGTALVGGGAAAASAGGAAAAGGASAGLLSAAGAIATVPVAGWIVGGVLAATAATIAIIKGIRNRKVSKKKAIAWAKRLGLPDPKSVPGFVLRLSKKPRSWRMKVLRRYKKRLKRVKKRQRKWRKRPGGRRVLQVLTFGILRGPDRLKKQRARLESKVALIEALNATYRRRARRRRQSRAEKARIARIERETPQAHARAVAANVDPIKYAGLEAWQWAAFGVTMGGLLIVAKAKQARRTTKTKPRSRLITARKR